MNRSKLKSQASPRVKQNPIKRAKRSSPGNPPKIGRYIIGLVVLGIISGFAMKKASAIVKSDPVFTVESVVLKGAEHLNTESILNASEIYEGTNIFEVDLKAVSKKLKKKFVAEDFIVLRKLPNTIVIKVKEREPVALLNTGTLIGVDSEGIPLPHIDASFVEELPIITGISSVEALRDSTTRKRLVTGLKLLARINQDAPSVYSRISELNVSSVSDMGFTLIDNGIEVLVGTSGWEKKVPNLENFISAALNRMEAVKTIDIRFGDKVYLRTFEGAKK